VGVDAALDEVVRHFSICAVMGSYRRLEQSLP
jgi:hypothetical protein